MYARWSDAELEALYAYREWRNDLHSCGRPLSESLQVNGQIPPDYLVGVQVCKACEKHERFQHDQQKKNQAALKRGDFVPQASHLHRIYTRQEAREIEAAERLAVEAAKQWAADQAARSLTQQTTE